MAKPELSGVLLDCFKGKLVQFSSIVLAKVGFSSIFHLNPLFWFFPAMKQHKQWQSNSIRLFFRPYILLSVRTSVHPYVLHFVHSSVCPYFCPSILKSVRSSLCPFFRPSILLFICFSVLIYVCSSICLFFRIYVLPFICSSVLWLWLMTFLNILVLKRRVTGKK